jgi:Flp pilus assembly protein TadG
MNNRRKERKWKRGSSAVELALTLPIFIILFIGIIEFGWYFFVQHTMQYATREGMRLALVGRTLNDSSGTPMTREASIIQTIKDNAMLPMIRNAVQVSIYPLNTGYTDPVGWQTAQNAGDPGEYMRVRSRYNHIFFTPLIGGFFSGGGIVIQAEGTYRNELFN